MQVRFYLKRPNEEKYTAIFARISYSGYQVKFYIPESIKPAHWNKDTQRAKENKKFPEYPEFNARLNNAEQKIKNAIRKYANDNDGAIVAPERLKQILTAEFYKIPDIGRPTLFKFFDDFIERSEKGARVNPKTKKPISKGTTKMYRLTRRVLRDFEKLYYPLDFNKITLDFYNDFMEFAHLEDMSANYIGQHVRTIKLIMREAADSDIPVPGDYKKKSFASIEVDVESIALRKEELDEMIKLDLSGDAMQDKVRDLFIIGCYTGLRFSDYSMLTYGHIKHGMITIEQTKTGNKVVIPVHNRVKEILVKYKNKLPTAPSNQENNRSLKEIAAKLDCLKVPEQMKVVKGGKEKIITTERCKLVHTHTARRSFATNEYLAGTPTKTIMAITGHKSERAFLKYIKVTPDEHAKILQVKWKERADAAL